MRYPNALGNNAPAEHLPSSAIAYTESKSLFRRLVSNSLPVEQGRSSAGLASQRRMTSPGMPSDRLFNRSQQNISLERQGNSASDLSRKKVIGTGESRSNMKCQTQLMLRATSNSVRCQSGRKSTFSNQ